MNQIHLNYLISIGNNDQGYVGANSLKWGKSILKDISINTSNSRLEKFNEIDQELDKKLNRYELFDYCQNHENIIDIIIAILSWGGMRRDHGRMLFDNLNYLLPFVDLLRNKKIESRFEAFDKIQKIRISGKLPGLGIGYFTKLICFLAPQLNGYIMDQWVSKSINLLSDKEIVRITNKVWVDDRNNADVYERFCTKIDEIAEILECDGFEAEKRLFSVGRGNGTWRKYLIKHY